MKGKIQKAVNIAKTIAQGAKGTLNKGVHIKTKSHKDAKGTRDREFDISIQHPEWYENYNVDGLIGLNINTRQNVSTPNSEIWAAYSQYDGAGRREELVGENNSTMPSIAALSTQLSIPTDSEGKQDVWSQSCAILYNRIRLANAGSVNYSPQQLEAYVQNVRCAHALYAALKRGYSLINAVSISDSQSPKMYFTALGIDYEDFATNAANIKMYGNLFSNKISNLLPLKIDLIARTRWMFGNLFKDSEQSKANLYVFKLRSLVYVPKLNTSGTKTAIVGGATSLAPTKWADLKAVCDTFLNDITSDYTSQIIAGDILKAFGDEMVYPTEIWSDTECCSPIYDQPALTQIQNATIGTYGTDNSTVNYTLEQGMTARYQTKILAAEVRGYVDKCADLLEKVTVNTNKDKLSAGEILSATRLTHPATVTVNEAGDYIFNYSVGTEFVFALDVFRFFDVNNNIPASVNMTPLVTNINSKPGFGFTGFNYFTNILRINNIEAQANPVSTVTAFGAISNFRFHPMVYPLVYIANYFTMNEGDSTETPVLDEGMVCFGPLFDYNNATVLDSMQSDAYHGYATMSLLHVKRGVKTSNATEIIE